MVLNDLALPHRFTGEVDLLDISQIVPRAEN